MSPILTEVFQAAWDQVTYKRSKGGYIPVFYVFVVLGFFCSREQIKQL